MSVVNTLPTPVIQMGLVEKLVEAEQNQPYVQQLVSQHAAGKSLKAEGERVPVVDATEHGKRVREREAGGQGRHDAQQQHARQPSAEDSDQEPALEPGPSPANPWAGNILNVKV